MSGISISNAARLVGVHKSTLYRWIEKNKVKAMRDPATGHVWLTYLQMNELRRRMTTEPGE